jgi:hypothetical protein
MKIKHFILIVFMLLICACQKVNDESLEQIVGKVSSHINSSNVYRTGYSYYLPTGLNVKEYSLYNELLESSDYTFYLYVDLISYYNQTKNTYEKNDKAYYSATINHDDKYGYIEINLKENNQYLIEIMYNYAKIEVIVDEKNINLAVSCAVSILRSIEYNDNIIANLLGDDVLSYQEEAYNIFNTESSENSNVLKAIEEDKYVEEESIKDTDLIN